MKNLIVCLGFSPNDDGMLLPVLKNRLDDAVDLCRKNPGSTLILMGSFTYRSANQGVSGQSTSMRKYIEETAADILEVTEIILEDGCSSTVAELCFLREFIDREQIEGKIFVVASEFFVERVKVYASYILRNYLEISFVGSKVFEDEVGEIKSIEMEKLKKAQEWLRGHERGDYQTILREQKEFERKVLSGEIEHRASSSFKIH
jgi:hypothetical protein